VFSGCTDQTGTVECRRTGLLRSPVSERAELQGLVGGVVAEVFGTWLAQRSLRFGVYKRQEGKHLPASMGNDDRSRASGFNDPWDCKPSFAVPDEREGLERLVQYMHAASVKHASHTDPAERDARTRHYLANPSQLRADLAAGSAEMWAQMDRRYRIYCLSARPDSQLMWGHYAEHHRGVCLEFDTHTPDFCSAAEVTYNATYPIFFCAMIPT
jgi:hypothetical protein